MVVEVVQAAKAPAAERAAWVVAVDSVAEEVSVGVAAEAGWAAELIQGGRNGTSTGMSRSGSSLGKQSPTDILSKTPQLSSRLQSLLPAGTNLTDAASGFKNLGQFVAAVHVSHNLGISFNDLKAKMISGDNLGQAIHTLDPNVNARHEAKKANKQSKKDLNEAASNFQSNS
ncbi:MAG: hypothetical protein ACYDA9_10225 [Terriglobia bacterium]